MTLTIKAEALAGSRVEDTAQDMIGLARRTGASVEVQFNSVLLLADENTDPALLAQNFYRVLKTDRRHKIATGWRPKSGTWTAAPAAPVPAVDPPTP